MFLLLIICQLLIKIIIIINNFHAVGILNFEIP